MCCDVSWTLTNLPSGFSYLSKDFKMEALFIHPTSLPVWALPESLFSSWLRRNSSAHLSFLLFLCYEFKRVTFRIFRYLVTLLPKSGYTLNLKGSSQFVFSRKITHQFPRMILCPSQHSSNRTNPKCSLWSGRSGRTTRELQYKGHTRSHTVFMTASRHYPKIYLITVFWSPVLDESTFLSRTLHRLLLAFLKSVDGCRRNMPQTRLSIKGASAAA